MHGKPVKPELPDPKDNELPSINEIKLEIRCPHPHSGKDIKNCRLEGYDTNNNCTTLHPLDGKVKSQDRSVICTFSIDFEKEHHFQTFLKNSADWSRPSDRFKLCVVRDVELDPGEVCEFKDTKQDDNLKLSWKKPQRKAGAVKYYRLEIKIYSGIRSVMLIIHWK